MQKTFKITYKPFGNQAVLIEWPARISERILYDILAYKQRIIKYYKGIYDCSSAFNSLTLFLKNPISDFNKEVSVLQEIYQKKYKHTKMPYRVWYIPVCYDAEFGPDLESYLETKQLTLKQLITLHTKPVYTVYFLGFLPGFPYLGGLPKVLHLARKATPVHKVVKGSVGIGGRQTGIYTAESPAGWHIIGKTPISLFDADLPEPSFLQAGDKIKFFSISKSEFDTITGLVNKKSYTVKSKNYA